MNLARKLVAPAVVALPFALAVACAEGSKAGPTDAPKKQEQEPTEPDESIPVPPPRPREPEDAGSDATPDATTPKPSEPDPSACPGLEPGTACVLAPQCGCREDETCDIVDRQTGEVGCIVAGTGAIGSTCVTPTQCGKGLTCADGVCRPWCEKGATTCSGENLGACRQLQDPPGHAVPNGNICTLACDLQDPAPVCGKNNCLWDPDVKASDCAPSGTKGAYEACSRYSDCQPGLVCIRATAFKVECEPWCRIGHNEDCGLPRMCRDVYGAAAPVVGTDKLGHCQ